MRAYLHVVSRDPMIGKLPGFEDIIRNCVVGAPGVTSVTSIEPHSKGGFSVIFDREEELPDGFGDYFEGSELMCVF
jgi:hypothetical protein